MNCSKCGTPIEENSYYCLECGKPIQLVPDYNPIDEIIDNGLTGTTLPEDKPILKRTVKEKKQKTRRKSKAQKQLLILLFAFFLVLAAGGIYLLASNQTETYEYQMKKADECISKEEFDKAVTCLNKAAQFDAEKTEPFLKLAEVYLQQKKKTAAVKELDYVIELAPDCEEAYRMMIGIYEEDEEYHSIKVLLDNADDKIQVIFAEYMPAAPEFSLEEGRYSGSEEVALIADGIIYYTLDNTTPDEDAELYEGPLVLEEGKTVIRAICINEKGMASDEGVASYEVAYGSVDMPVISPGTGTYTEQVKITVQVPSGCTAHYTFDGSMPTKSSSKYVGPIPMPEGSYIFSVILVDPNGRQSSVATRSYELTLSQPIN